MYEPVAEEGGQRSPGRMRVTRDADPLPRRPDGCCAAEADLITDLQPFDEGRPCWLFLFPIGAASVLALFFLHMEFELVLMRTVAKDKLEKAVSRSVESYLPKGAHYFPVSLEAMRDRLYVSEVSVLITILAVLAFVYLAPRLLARRMQPPGSATGGGPSSSTAPEAAGGLLASSETTISAPSFIKTRISFAYVWRGAYGGEGGATKFG
eukprot:g8189.t1